MTFEDEVGSIAKLETKPGDVVVVTCKRRVGMASLERLAALVKSHLPDGVKCLVLERDISLQVLTRAEIEAKAT